jgi:hypothetical protein
MTFSLMPLSITTRNETLNKMPLSITSLSITYSAYIFVLLSVVNLGVIVLSVAAPTFLHLNGKP